MGTGISGISGGKEIASARPAAAEDKGRKAEGSRYGRINNVWFWAYICEKFMV